MEYKPTGRLAKLLRRTTLILLPPEDTGLPDELDRLVMMRNRQVAGMFGLPESQPIGPGAMANSDLERLMVSFSSEATMRETDAGSILEAQMSHFRFVTISGTTVAVIKREVGASFKFELRSSVGFVLGDDFLSSGHAFEELVDELGLEAALRLSALLEYLEFSSLELQDGDGATQLVLKPAR